jgi:hypothetical protein
MTDRPAPTRVPAHTPADRLERWAPLAGVGFAVLDVAGMLVIDKFPDSDAPVARLSRYYAAHHAQVGRGGTLSTYAVIFLVVFGAAIWARIRRSAASPVVAGTVLLATAAFAATQLVDDSTYRILGTIGAAPTTSPGALQAWHISGAEGIASTDLVVLLLGVAAAGLTARAFPGWLSWSALALAVLALTPLAFFALLLFHVWAVAAGVALTMRPGSGLRELEPAAGPSAATALAHG